MNPPFQNQFMNRNMNMNSNQNNNQEIPPAMKTIYAILSGSQSLISILGTIVDISFLLRQLKKITIDVLLIIIKKLFFICKGIVTLKWVGFLIKMVIYIGNRYIINNEYVSKSVGIVRIAVILCKIN